MDLTQEDWHVKASSDSNGQILDVRTKEEWEEGIIPNAKLLDIYQGEEFLEKIKDLDKSKNYYVYCKAGGRSHQACQIMKQLGFENTYNLIGGIMDWNGEIIPPPDIMWE